MLENYPKIVNYSSKSPDISAAYSHTLISIPSSAEIDLYKLNGDVDTRTNAGVWRNSSTSEPGKVMQVGRVRNNARENRGKFKSQKDT